MVCNVTTHGVFCVVRSLFFVCLFVCLRKDTCREPFCFKKTFGHEKQYQNKAASQFSIEKKLEWIQKALFLVEMQCFQVKPNTLRLHFYLVFQGTICTHIQN